MTQTDAEAKQCSCREAFAKVAAEPKHRVQAAREAHPSCACEQVSVSAHSPGKIEDHETIVRAIFESDLDPDTKEVRWDKLDSAAFRGLSVIRGQPAFDPEQDLSKVVAERGKPIKGRLVFKVIDVRRVFQEVATSERVFCVYDVAESEKHLHAEIHLQKRQPASEMDRYLRKLRNLGQYLSCNESEAATPSSR